jgi:hypothetical protein
MSIKFILNNSLEHYSEESMITNLRKVLFDIQNNCINSAYLPVEPENFLYQVRLTEVIILVIPLTL